MTGDLSQSGQTIDRQLGLYEEQANSWKSQHDRAVNCLDLEAVLGLGLHIYRSIKNADERWSESVRSGAMSLKEGDARRLSEWYSGWVKPCDSILRLIREFELDGYHVDQASEFREACLDVRSLLSIPVERALAANGAGTRRSMAEVRDALRRRLER